MNTQPPSLRIFALLAASSLFAFGLAACGGSETPAPAKTPIAQQAPPPAEPAAVKPTPPAAPPAAAASPAAAPASKPETTAPAAAKPAQTPAPTATASATKPAQTAPAASPSTAPAAAPGKPPFLPLPPEIEPQATTTAAPPAPQPTPAPTSTAATSGVNDPGGEVAVAAKSGTTRVGAEKCKVCHKIQYASWSEGGHAKRKPALECENCHGAGSEYKVMATMKDAAKAKAAGLVMPDAKFCQTCHKQGWKDELLKKAHAHKAG